MINKSILEQYADMMAEIDELQENVDRLERKLDKIQDDGCVKDIVKGGEGGIQHFMLEGFPMPEFERTRKAWIKRKDLLERRKVDLEEKTNDIEEFINEIDDSLVRRIIEYRIVQQMPWRKVALHIGKGTTEEAVRKIYERYLQKQNLS